MSHKFKVGQRVRQFKVGYAAAKSDVGDLFDVVRLMPEDRSGEPLYRVKSTAGERVVREGEIILAS